jgi:hypothetical protein
MAGVDLQATVSCSKAPQAAGSGQLFARRLERSDFKPYRKSMRKFTRRILLGLLILVPVISGSAALQLSREQGNNLERKIDEINKNASTDPVRPKRTPMSELEVNSYLVFNIKNKIPRGLANPEIHIVGSDQLAGRVFVDLDEFKRQRGNGGFMDPLSYISGQVPLIARGLLRTREGKGRFQLSSAEILGVPLPKRILQELVGFFSRTPENPNGLNMDAPFNLPAKIREVAVAQGEVVVVQ